MIKNLKTISVCESHFGDTPANRIRILKEHSSLYLLRIPVGNMQTIVVTGFQNIFRGKTNI